MPLYDYGCETCQVTWEEMRSMDERDLPCACPACGQPGKRVFLHAPILAWSQASADGGRPYYRERLKKPESEG